MSETTSRFRIELDGQMQRDALGAFLEAFSYTESGPFAMTEGQRQILSALPTPLDHQRELGIYGNKSLSQSYYGIRPTAAPKTVLKFPKSAGQLI